jgi:hypothetical protein
LRRVRRNIGVRAAYALGLFLFSAALASCGPRDPASVADAADRAAGGGVFRWLAAHDPSALVVVNVDAPTARAVAPDARVRVARSVKDGCRIALAGHALLAARVAYGTQERQLADDCGYGLFRDEATIVVAPR